jgi:glycine dehydrogenase subunit 2
MITNPNTCGLFEPDMAVISEAVMRPCAVYCDGANFNAIVGRVRPGDLGIDACTSTCTRPSRRPHGGGGPGAGPVVFSEALDAVRAAALRRAAGRLFALVERHGGRGSQPHVRRMTAFHGQMGMFTRAAA